LQKFFSFLLGEHSLYPIGYFQAVLFCFVLVLQYSDAILGYMRQN